MTFALEERQSDSPYVESIGHFQVENDYSHICGAGMLWNMLLVNYQGQRTMTIWKPERESGLMSYPAGAEFLYIRFKLGSFLPRIPLNNIGDTGLFLPDASTQSFWLDSSAWQYPNFENVDTFVNRLVHEGLITWEPIVDDLLQDQALDMPSRTVRYRFLRATGISPTYIRQLERARNAVSLLEKGTSILDTVYQAGYADQAHLTRSLKRFIGLTPTQIIRLDKAQ